LVLAGKEIMSVLRITDTIEEFAFNIILKKGGARQWR